MSETKEDAVKMCTKCNKFPQSMRKGVQKGMCCNRCPSHGPWCSSHLHQQASSCNHPPPVARVKAEKRKAQDDVIQSEHPQHGKLQPRKKCKLTSQLLTIVKELRDAQSIPKSVCNTLRASLSQHCTTISSEVGPLQQKAFGSYQQMKAFRMLSQTFNSIEAEKAAEVQRAEVLASQAVQEFAQFEKATEEARMELVVSSDDVQAKTSALSESVAAVSILHQRIATLSSQHATDEVAPEKVLNAMTKSQQMQMVKWQRIELTATNASVDAACKKQEALAESLDEAKHIQCKKAATLEEKLHLLPELRSVSEEVMQTPSAALRHLKDFRQGPLASFLEISAELVMLYGIQILDADAARQSAPEECQIHPAQQLEDLKLLGELFDVENTKLRKLHVEAHLGEEEAFHEPMADQGHEEQIGNHSAAASAKKQPGLEEVAASDDNHKLLNLGGA